MLEAADRAARGAAALRARSSTSASSPPTSCASASIVHVKDEKSGKSLKFTIVGSAEANAAREPALERVAGRQGRSWATSAARRLGPAAQRPSKRKLKITKIDVGL